MKTSSNMLELGLRRICNIVSGQLELADLEDL